MKLEDIEQTRPNKPNFGLILILSLATILILFVVALFVVRFDGQHLVLRHHQNHPTSQLIQPQIDMPFSSVSA